MIAMHDWERYIARLKKISDKAAAEMQAASPERPAATTMTSACICFINDCTSVLDYSSLQILLAIFSAG